MQNYNYGLIVNETNSVIRCLSQWTGGVIQKLLVISHTLHKSLLNP